MLYTFARNPLTHSFGIGKAAELFPGVPEKGQTAIWLAKTALTRPQAETVLAGDPTRPPWLPPTLRSEPGGVVLNVATLAWGTAAMVRALFRDPQQRVAADVLAAQLLGANR